MQNNGFRSFYWGFLFVLIDFRIGGFDVLPDIVGYIMFASGFAALIRTSDYFRKGRSLNMAMIVLAIFSIYQPPAHGGGITVSPFGPAGLLIGLAALLISLFVVHDLFMGTAEVATAAGRIDLAKEARLRWSQFLWLQIAVLGAFVLMVVPGLALMYIIGLIVVSIALTVAIMRLMGRCAEELPAR